MKNYLINLFAIILFAAMAFTGCEQQETLPVGNNINEEFPFSLAKHYNLPKELLNELQQAKIATAKYNHIENALADGYEDIGVVVPQMGHHYMKSNIVNGVFEIDKPEILVYSPHPVTGKMRLVAVEYAVPLDFPEPEGFTGDLDEWDENTGFGLWLL